MVSSGTRTHDTGATNRYFNQLNYATPKKWFVNIGTAGLEPTVYCSQGRYVTFTPRPDHYTKTKHVEKLAYGL
jgi:hypothetical protein